MARRDDYREGPERRGPWQGEGEVGEHDRPWMRGREPEFGVRRGGGYGLGGAERGYNQGGYGGVESHEEGYTPGSYDRLLDMTERYYGYGDEGYGRAREEDEHYWYEQDQARRSEQAHGGRSPDERYGPGALGFGREAWSDEWMGPEREKGPREDLRGGAMEWTARSRGLGKAPRGYARSDERIREDICERLMDSPYDASNVEITVNRGEVTLMGTVRRRAEKWGIEDVAESILGVLEVKNRIRVDRGEAQALEPSAVGDTRNLHS